LIGTTDIGKSTELRSGKMAMLSGIGGSEKAPPDPLSGGAGSDGEWGGRCELAMCSMNLVRIFRSRTITQHFEGLSEGLC
jgi:hypothetical protein